MEHAQRWSLEDGLLNPNALTHGDLNSDGREDLVLLGDGFIYRLGQNEDRHWPSLNESPYSGTVQSVQVLDIQGDGRSDLLLVNWDSPNPFRFRLQTEDRQLSPETSPLPPIGRIGPMTSIKTAKRRSSRRPEIRTRAGL
jgi:hypothetical protein